MSPKNARLKTNGDQSSSTTIQTDAILGVEVSAIKIGSEAPKPVVGMFILPTLLGGHVHGSAAPWI